MTTRETSPSLARKRKPDGMVSLQRMWTNGESVNKPCHENQRQRFPARLALRSEIFLLSLLLCCRDFACSPRSGLASTPNLRLSWFSSFLNAIFCFDQLLHYALYETGADYNALFLFLLDSMYCTITTIGSHDFFVT